MCMKTGRPLVAVNAVQISRNPSLAHSKDIGHSLQSKPLGILHSHIQKTSATRCSPNLSVSHAFKRHRFQLTSKWHLRFPPCSFLLSCLLSFILSKLKFQKKKISWVLPILPATLIPNDVARLVLLPEDVARLAPVLDPEVTMPGTEAPSLKTTPGAVVASGPPQIPSCAPPSRSALPELKIDHFAMAASGAPVCQSVRCDSVILPRVTANARVKLAQERSA